MVGFMVVQTIQIANTPIIDIYFSFFYEIPFIDCVFTEMCNVGQKKEKDRWYLDKKNC